MRRHTPDLDLDGASVIGTDGELAHEEDHEARAGRGVPDGRRTGRAAALFAAVAAVAIAGGLVALWPSTKHQGKAPLEFAATTPSTPAKTGDEIARIRAALRDRSQSVIEIGAIKDARVYALNADSPDETQQEWTSLVSWITNTCELARGEGWALQLTARTDPSGSRSFNAGLATRRAAIAADLISGSTCWKRDEIKTVSAPAGGEFGKPDQDQRRVTAQYVRVSST